MRVEPSIHSEFELMNSIVYIVGCAIVIIGEYK